MDELTKRIEKLPTQKRALLEQRLKRQAAKPSRQKQQPAAVESQPPCQRYDVVILGGGLAGLTLAMQIKQTRPATSVLVVERRTHPVPESAFKVGESTVELGAFYLRQVLGLAERLKASQLPKAGLRFFFTAGDNSDIRRRVEFGPTYLPPVPSYQLDRGRFENMLGCETINLGVTFWDGCKVQRVSLGGKEQLVFLRREGEARSVSARWIVDATGRGGLLKRQLGLVKPVDHNANAAWFRIGDKIDLDDWSKDAHWRAQAPPGLRWLGTNHLMGRGYWVWLIPLVSGATSVGIVTDADVHPFRSINRFERALNWLREYEPQCAEAIEQRRRFVLDFRALKNYAYGCKQVYSADRWCLTGEAGVFVDPFYSPGSDLIGISNGFISDLILRDLGGEAIEDRARHYNRIFLNTFESLLCIYQRQYRIMGNAQVMIAKIVWDFVIYWAFVSLLFFRNKLCDLQFMSELGNQLQRVNHLNVRMQEFFRQWASLDQREWKAKFIDLLEVDVLYELHHFLMMDLTAKQVKARISRNMDLLESLAVGMFRQAVQRLPVCPPAVAINPYAVSLRPEHWHADELFPVGDKPMRSARLTAGLNKIWLEAVQ